MSMKTQNLSEDYLKELGHRLKIIRTFLKLDQRQMAKSIKTGQSQLSKLESGLSAPTLFHLISIKRMADEDNYLRENLSWEWILEGKGRGLVG
jgi:transcriptional regulator with XRE-family HTH domain